MAGYVHLAILVLLFWTNIEYIHCFDDYSWNSLPSKWSDYYHYGDYADVADACSPCICVPSDNQEMDIFCFVSDIPNWFTDTTSNFKPPGDFKYLSVFELQPNDTIVAIDLPAYAFRRFQNVEDTLDKLHFHGAVFGTTDEHAFSQFPLKYLLVDSVFLAQGIYSFQSLIVALQDLQDSLMELHMVGVEILNQHRHGTTVDLPPLTDFSALTTIEFERVPLKYLEKNTFHNLPLLKYLSFSDCPLVSISSDTFGNVPALTVLQIASSQLTRLPNFLYNANIANLQALSLNNSFISDFEDFRFLKTFSSHHGHGLRFLDIRNNHVKTISPHALDNLNTSYTRNLEALYLWNNPFHCDCDLVPFVRWLQSVESKVDATFQSSLTPVEEIFGLDAHCIPRASCKVVHKESRLQNSFPMCESPVDQEESSLFSLNDMKCKSTKPRVSYVVGHLNNVNNSNSSNSSMYSSSFQTQRVIILSLTVFLVISILLVLLVVPIKTFARLVPYFKSDIFLFDVYISHHNNNAQLVNDKFIPRLEEEPNNLKLRLSCHNMHNEHLNTTDFLHEVFKTSRLTLFLIDSAFVNNDKCMLELNTAAAFLFSEYRPDHEKQRGLILLFLDDTPAPVMSNRLKRLRKKIVYLRWKGGLNDNNSDEEQQQWENLGSTLRKLNSDFNVMDICDV